MNQFYHPILLIIFNRPETTNRVFDSVSVVKPSQLFVAADGPRPDRAGEVEQCRLTREIVHRINWPCDLKILFRDENLGCKNAVSSAISWFFDHVDEGIILEDDCLPSKSFFAFCSLLLEKYRDDERIMMISGNNFQDDIQRGEASYYFSRIFHIWGWATWRKAWEKYDETLLDLDVACLQKKLVDVLHDENLALSWLHALCQVKAGVTNTWDYIWAANCLLNNGLSVTPNKNLVTNIGFGAGGTHTFEAHSSCANIARHEIADLIHPDTVECHEQADNLEYKNLYPVKPNMSLAYRVRRYRKSRRLKIKIDKLIMKKNYDTETPI